MKVRPIHETHTVHQSMESHRATVDAENMAVVVNMLSNIYSDPILAVVREYSTNARDSHVAAGKADQPIEVSLPKAHDAQPQLVIRDYGVGLSLDELRKTYLSYGASTKRESDEFNGTLGIGSKAGLTYAPLGFQVTSVKDGHKVLAVIAQDEDGVGVMRVLAEFETDESNGVTITIPVEQDDVDHFEDRADRLFRYWRHGEVLVDGEQPSTVYEDDSIIWADEDVALARNLYRHESVIVMGGVPYPFPYQAPGGYSVIAHVPMGSVHFTPSREALHYTDLTDETIADLKEFVEGALDRVIADHLASEGKGFQRLAEFYALRDHLDYNQRRRFERKFRSVVPMDPQALPSTAFRWSPGRRNGVSTFETLHFTALRDSVNSRQQITVLGYPHKSLTTAHKARLNRWLEETGGYTGRFFLLPEGVSADTHEMLEGLEGDGLVTWEEIVEATPPLPRVKGGSRPKTQYEVWKAGRMLSLTVDEIDVDANGPLLLRGYDRWGSQAREKSILMPEAQIIVLKGNQEPKIQREFPTMVPVYVYEAKRREEVKAALVDADGLRHWGHQWAWLADRVHEIADPELVDVLRAVVAAEDSDTLTEALRFGVRPSEPKALRDLSDRYPLLDEIREWQRNNMLDDLVAYLNGKWARVEAEREVSEAAEAIAAVASGANAFADVDND